MNRDIVAGNWKQLKGTLQVQWSMLIGDHLGVITGRRTQMAGERQRAYGVVCSRTLRDTTEPDYPARTVASGRKVDGVPLPMASAMIVPSHEKH